MTKNLDPITPSISKPYSHKRGFRCRLKTATGWRNGPTAPTEAEAIEAAQQLAEMQAHDNSQTVGACIDRYLEHHRDKGSRSRTVTVYRQHLIRFFAPVLDKPINYVTPVRAASLYERRRTSTGERTHKPLAVDTHRGALGVSRAFLQWCVERRWLKVNPLAQVKGVGAKRKGKQQPTIDEARALWAVCLREAATGDDGALAAAIAISMGLRSGEITSRCVRDLDNKDAQGMPQHLRVADNESLKFETKTRSSRRPVLIPEELRGMLQERTRDKLPTALLFPSTTGGMQWTVWLNRAVHRLCRQAGIPPVCAHALRGCSATAAAAAGATPQLVATMLGHSNPNITLGHYIQSGTVETHQRAEGLKVLQGAR